jgi:hypothetical protein
MWYQITTKCVRFHKYTGSKVKSDKVGVYEGETGNRSKI